MDSISRIRNIGISAHIDSGKTTLSERMLFYAGRIHRMREVHDRDGGATMDWMELEKERGITITSAATRIDWGVNTINLIDTPGHVDFTVEVERSLRVLDGGVMVLCAVGGVQSQSVTVDRQMKRYGVPRLAFINKMDRTGADPERVLRELEEKLDLRVLPIQMPIGTGDAFDGLVDLVTMEAVRFEGDAGERVVRGPVPAALKDEAEASRHAMLDRLSLHSDEMTDLLLEELDVPEAMIHETLREAALNGDLVPVLMGSALDNQGVQPLLDAVCAYLPSPLDRTAFARDHANDGAEVPLAADPDAPAVAMAFKVVDESFGRLSYVRIYQGRIEKGGTYTNARTGQTMRAGRLVRMHADQRDDLTDAGPGDIVAIVGADTASGDTLCGPGASVSLESIFVAEPVISLSVTPASSNDQDRMAKALNRFMREDPTFRVSTDPETGETVIAGMGELHLDVYVERLRREFKAQVTVGAPSVSYREAPTRPAEYDYRHKKQTGGAGQFAEIEGRLEPLTGEDDPPYEFEDNIKGGAVPREYIPAVSRGFVDAMKEGPLAGYEIVGCRLTLDDGNYHEVDSSEMAFHTAAIAAFRQAFQRSAPCLQEPIMAVEVETPTEAQGPIVADLTSRRGLVMATEQRGAHTVIRAEVPLASMFGYATVVRGLSKGMATFSMEMAHYARVPEKLAEEIIARRRRDRQDSPKQ